MVGTLASYARGSSFTKDLGDAFEHGPHRHRVLLLIVLLRQENKFWTPEMALDEVFR